MTAALTYCRDTILGGEGLAAPPAPIAAGSTWKAGTIHGAIVAAIQGVAVSDTGILIAGEDGAQVLRSTDGGANWYTVAMPAYRFGTPGWGGGKFLAGGNCGRQVYASSDGLTWSLISSSVGVPGTGGYWPFYADGLWFASQNAAGTVATCTVSSNGGITWTVASADAAGVNCNPQSWCWDGTQFLGGGAVSGNQYLLTSPDGLHWTDHPVTSGALSPFALTYANGVYVLCCNNGIVIESSLAALLSTPPTALPNQTGGLAVIPLWASILPSGRIVVFTSNGFILSSINGGATWTNDTPAWQESSGSLWSAYPVAQFGGYNLAAAGNNSNNNVAVRGVTCGG